MAVSLSGAVDYYRQYRADLKGLSTSQPEHSFDLIGNNPYENVKDKRCAIDHRSPQKYLGG